MSQKERQSLCETKSSRIMVGVYFSKLQPLRVHLSHTLTRINYAKILFSLVINKQVVNNIIFHNIFVKLEGVRRGEALFDIFPCLTLSVAVKYSM